MADAKRILAVSSHVVHGYVGNRASTLPLQLLQWDVDVLNTVSFSNHTGYTQWRGDRHSAQHIRDIYTGLKMNTLTDYDVVVTGYIPGAEAVREVGAVVQELRRDNAELGREVLWILDPVMGDEHKLYVAPDVIPVYESLLPLATVITPNQFEAELLSGIQFHTAADITKALGILYDKFGTPNIVISSAVTGDNVKKDEFICAGQTLRKDGSLVRFYLRLPFINAYFTGTGDLFASLMSDRFWTYYTAAKNNNNNNTADGYNDAELPLVRAVEDVSAIVQAVLRNTADEVHKYNVREDKKAAETGIARPEPGTKERRIRDMKFGELRLIQSQDKIRVPDVVVKARFDLA
ncbi:Ribokinase-like protein [Lipomyces kononenkoae]|uniref:Ribokinase-like protein n=1 Tax=Lipomyces kononenkoae TaxID=34357 RepID=A0ACC3T9L4_LIPKO